MAGPIIERSRVREAVERELAADPRQDVGAAINAVAEALCLPAEAVAECLGGGEVPA